MSKYKHQAVIDEFRRKFTVFDGHQNIVKHVTYSSWVEQFLDEQLKKKEEEIVDKAIKKVDELFEPEYAPSYFQGVSDAIDKIKELKTQK